MGRMSLYQCDRFQSKRDRARKTYKKVCITCNNSENGFESIESRDDHINKYCKTSEYGECEHYVKQTKKRKKPIYIKAPDPIEIIEQYIHGQGQTHWVDRICGVI